MDEAADWAALFFFGGRLLARLKPVSNDLVLALHLFQFCFGLFVAGDSSLMMARPFQRAVLTMRH